MEAPIEIEPRPGADISSEAVEVTSVAKGSAMLFAARVVGNAGFFVAVLILTLALEVSERGQFAFITTGSQVVARVATIGVPDATTIFAAQMVDRRPRLLSNLTLFSIVTSALLAVLFCLAMLASGEATRLGFSTINCVLFAAGSVLSAIAAAGLAFLTGCGRYRVQAWVSAATPWMYAVLIVGCWTIEPLNVQRSLEIWVGYYAFWAGALLIAANRLSPLGRLDLPLLRRALRFGVKAWAGSVTLLLNFRTDQLVMGFITTQAALGIYVVAVNASETLLILPDAVAVALVAVLARSSSTSRAERTIGAFRIVSLITLGLVAVAGLAAPLVIPAVFGTSYRASVVPFLWLAAGTLGFVASQVFGKALLASSSPGLGSIAQVASLAIGTALDFALVPSFGATGAAAAAAIAFGFGGVVSLVAYRRREPFAYRDLVPSGADLTFIREAARNGLRLVAAKLARVPTPAAAGNDG